MNDKQIIAEVLRRELCLPVNITDDEILKNTEGTLIRARMELSIEIERLWSEMKRALLFWK